MFHNFNDIATLGGELNRSLVLRTKPQRQCNSSKMSSLLQRGGNQNESSKLMEHGKQHVEKTVDKEDVSTAIFILNLES